MTRFFVICVTFKMDPPPLVPNNEEDHDVLPVITEIFQNTFRTNKYPINIAENIRKYRIDDNEPIKINAMEVLQVIDDQDLRLNDVGEVENEIMEVHAKAFIEKYRNLPWEEFLKLKRNEIFEKLSNHAYETYELIQRTDIYPNKIEQYLDFTYNTSLHTCNKPCPHPTEDQSKEKLKKTERKKYESPVRVPEAPSTFTTEPDKIVFHNCEINQIYTKKFKLRNITSTPKCFKIVPSGRSSPFDLKMLTSGSWLAPGMCAEFLITYKPKIYQNFKEIVKFKTMDGNNIDFVVYGTRDSPKLICYVHNPLFPHHLIKKPGPGSQYFSERRQNALNFTIDCGTCLLGNYSVATLIMKNIGEKGRFFVTSESEWYSTKLYDTTTRVEKLKLGYFLILPVYFEIDKNDVGEIFIFFYPEYEGVFTEKIIITCDNNSYQEVEILGDCILFSATFLKVNMYLLENTFSYTNRKIAITLAPNETSTFLLSVVNNSSIYFDYYWAIKTPQKRELMDYDKANMTSDWIKFLNHTKCIPPFSTTDVMVEVEAKATLAGFYYIYISLYLKNIPISSVPARQQFIITNQNEQNENRECPGYFCSSAIKNEDDKKKISKIYGVADVHICELEILCTVKIPLETVFEKTELLLMTKVPLPKYPQKLKISKAVLKFGILPKGVETKESLMIENLTDSEVGWKLVEIHLDNNMQLTLVEADHLKHFKGVLNRPGQKRKITYKIKATECVCWVSLLALFSTGKSCYCDDLILESTCLVVYEIAEIKVKIQGDHNLPILCPKKELYVEVPTTHSIYISNVGILVGCYYFLKPVGRDADKIRITFSPQSGIIYPGVTVAVKVELLPLQNGIIEDLYVPVFVGDLDQLISLKIFCIVGDIAVNFYLPCLPRAYNKIRWLPQIPTMSTWHSPVIYEDYDESIGEGDKVLTPVESETKDDLKDLISDNSVAITYPTVKMNRIHTKTPTKLTFYIENLTPIHGKFHVQAINFGPEFNCINNVFVKAKTKTAQFFWEKACHDGFGIAIEPECPSGNIVPHEVVEINLWIYATTWGKYLEEVTVEINELTPFCFNLIVDVVGSAVTIPFALNTKLDYPTIRFENVSFSCPTGKKSFTVTNISSVDVYVKWYIFENSVEDAMPFNIISEFIDEKMKLKLTDKCYGLQACSTGIEITPYEFELEKSSSVTVTVSVDSSAFMPSPDKIKLNYNIIGFIYLKNEEDRYKENYFRRLEGTDLEPVQIKVNLTLEMPLLQIDLLKEDTVIDLFVNDILFNELKDPEIYFLVRNVDKSAINFSLTIDKPFQITRIRSISSGIVDPKCIVLHKDECLQVMLSCQFTPKNLIDFAEFIYNDRNGMPREIIDNYISSIRRNLVIFQKKTPCQIIPFEVRLHYPHIEVKPNFIKFGACLLYRTKKIILTIYNLTASIVKFEIYKTSCHDDFEVHPSYGEVARTTGANKQFVDITIYFTPRHCKTYIESLKIMTNFHQYYFDVPLTGHGTNNEKFYID